MVWLALLPTWHNLESPEKDCLSIEKDWVGYEHVYGGLSELTKLVWEEPASQ